MTKLLHNIRKQVNHNVRAICAETWQCAYTIVNSSLDRFKNTLGLKRSRLILKLFPQT